MIATVDDPVDDLVEGTEPDSDGERNPRRFGGRLFANKPTGGSRRSPKVRRDPTLAGLWRLRALRIVFFAALVVGLIGGTKALLFSSSGPQPVAGAAGTDVVEVPRDVGVGGFGELYVAAWLTAGNTNAGVIGPYYSKGADLSAVTSGSYWASRTAVVAVEETAPDYWAVTVGADVLVADDEGVYEPGNIRYYTVGVVKSEDGFGATGLPSQVPPPATLEAPELVIEAMGPPSGDLEPFADALDGFFDALLAGSGNLERFVAPNTLITAITPPPFVDTEIVSLGARPDAADPDRYLLRVQVAATNDISNIQVLQYTAVISERAQRWEVAELVAASPIANQ